MPAYQSVFNQYRTSLQPLYDAQEAAAIAKEALLEITGITYSQSLTKTDDLPEAQAQQLQEMLGRLQAGEPLQYVLGHAYFMGRKFAVNKDVLIPRPETEELVQWIIDDWETTQSPCSVLDIGAGSGCIPVSLKAALDKGFRDVVRC